MLDNHLAYQTYIIGHTTKKHGICASNALKMGHHMTNCKK